MATLAFTPLAFAATLSSIAIKPATVVGGNPFRLVIRLNRKGSMNVKIHSSDQSLVRLSNVNFLINNTSAREMVVPTQPNASNQTKLVQITVTSGAQTRVAHVRVMPYPTPAAPPTGNVGTRIYSFRGGNVFNLLRLAQERGYTLSAQRVGGHGNGFCRFQMGSRGVSLLSNLALSGRNSVVCKFQIMEGAKRLRTGWTLHSVVLDHSYYGYKWWEYAVAPRYGTNDPGFTVRVKNESGHGKLFDYDLKLKAIYLRGPAGRSWQDALLR